MADIPVISEVVQIGAEVTKGTPVLATRKLLGISINPSIEFEGERFRPIGSKFPTIVIPGKEWSMADIEGKLNYNELPYVFASLMRKATPTVVGTLGRQWVFAPTNGQVDDPQSYTCEYGSAQQARSFSYGIINSAELTFSRSAADIAGAMFGQLMTEGAQLSTNERQTVTITGTPTGGTFTLTFLAQTTAPIAYNATAAAVQSALELLSTIGAGNVFVTGGPGPGTPWVVEFRGTLGQQNVALMTDDDTLLTGGVTPTVTVTETRPGAAAVAQPLIPIVPRTMDFRMADTQAGLAAALPLERGFEITWNLNDRFGPIWPVRSTLASFGAHIETEPSSDFTITLGLDADAQALLGVMRAGAIKFFRVTALGPEIEVGTNYSFQLDVAMRIDDVGEYGELDGLKVIDFTGPSVHDAVWNKAMEATVVCALTAL